MYAIPGPVNVTCIFLSKVSEVGDSEMPGGKRLKKTEFNTDLY